MTGSDADARATIAGLHVGDRAPVRLAGAINVSPESFHTGSVASDLSTLVKAALGMVEAGADLIDVGARSTAPYLETAVSPEEEARRLGAALSALVAELPVPVSADTHRPLPARVALEAGARILNDVTGLADPGVAALARRFDGVVLMAWGDGPWRDRPIARVAALLRGAIQRARAAEVPLERIVVDPGIGFFRQTGIPWFEWDGAVLARLGDLLPLGRPLCVGVSRKSFIGALSDSEGPEDRLPGSLAAAAIAVLHGARLIRTHDVAETRQAVRVAEAIRRHQAEPCGK
jgi:dihydropteroate synthase